MLSRVINVVSSSQGSMEGQPLHYLLLTRKGKIIAIPRKHNWSPLSQKGQRYEPLWRQALTLGLSVSCPEVLVLFRSLL